MTDGWFIDGVPVDTVGRRLLVYPDAWPGKRGQDVQVARRHGTVQRRKFYEPRTLSFVVEVIDEDEFGRRSEAVFWANVDRLKAALHADAVQLTRRVTQPSGAIQTRKGTFEVVSAPQVSPAREGRHGTVSWDALFHNPFLYAPEARKLAQSGTFTVNNVGTVRHYRVRVSLHGPASNPSLTNITAGTSFTFNGTIPTSGRVDLDADTFNVTDENDLSVAGSVSRSSHRFVELDPGINRLELSDGTCDIAWEAAFL